MSDTTTGLNYGDVINDLVGAGYDSDVVEYITDLYLDHHALDEADELGPYDVERIQDAIDQYLHEGL